MNNFKKINEEPLVLRKPDKSFILAFKTYK